MTNKVFRQAGGQRPGKSAFNLSHSVKLSCDFGQLMPVYAEDCVPGDVFELGINTVIRMQPLAVPVMHEINATWHFFFVPYDILWDDLEEFITGGPNGTSTPTNIAWTPSDTTLGSLWENLGFPLGTYPSGLEVTKLPMRAYNKIFNDYYRDQVQTNEISLDTEDIQYRCWEKDYFTAARPWLQRGTPVALPVTISGTVAITGKDEDITMHNETDATARTLSIHAAGNNVEMSTTPSGDGDARWDNTALEVDGSGFAATSFDISDFRLAYQTQRIFEILSRAGGRYKEFIEGMFGPGTAPRDDTLERPEYIGGLKSPVVVSEVLQTGESGTTPQGNMAGHGMSIARGRIGKYRVKEYGCIMGIMSIMPKAVYEQGVDRRWIKETRYDFYLPKFASLSDQPIYKAELKCVNGSTDDDIFGYQGRYDEMRVRQDSVRGEMRMSQGYDHWHLSRQFASVPALNGTFLYTSATSPRKDFLAAPSEPAFLVNNGNLVRAVRPLPFIARPAL